MRLLDTLQELLGRGIDLLEQASRVSVHQLTDLGLNTSSAREWRRLADVFFGPTRSTRKQADAVTAARANGHSVQTLSMINRMAKQVPEGHRWRLRRDLCRINGPYAAVLAEAKKLVDALRDPEPAATRSLTVGRNPGKRQATLRLTGPEPEILGLAAQLEASGPAARYDEFMDKIRGDGTFPEPTIVTNAIISIDDLDKILNGEGEEIEFALTNGARMTGAEYVKARHAEYMRSVLAIPMQGLINAYTHARFANRKQRLLAELENPVCPWPGCNQPADSCQIHHIDAWKHGGPTDQPNLCTVCGYHNGVNDDDPHTSRRGRLVRYHGEVFWVPPGGGPPRRNEHPTAALGAMRLVNAG